MEGMMAWIPQSPDLSAMDVFLWGPVINKVPSHIPQDFMGRLQAAVTKLVVTIYMKILFYGIHVRALIVKTQEDIKMHYITILQCNN
jgi:hypothetical protein